MTARLFLLIALACAALVATPARAAQILAVLELSGALPDDQRRALTDAVREEATKAVTGTSLKVMTQENMEILLTDMGEDASCISEGACEVETLRNLQASYGITGKVTDFGGTYLVTLQLYEMRGGTMVTAEKVKSTEPIDLVTELAPAATRTLLASLKGSGNTSSSPSTPPRPSSSIGTAGAGAGESIAAADVRPVAELPPMEPAPVEEGECHDLVALEGPAMMGELGTTRRECLERRLASATSQTDKRKLSLVLLVDAEARQDVQAWAGLMQRHLEQIDHSDPNMCYKFAAYLSRKGVGSADAVIRWSDHALENKQEWSGHTYKKYVYGLYRLRAQAANELWQQAEAGSSSSDGQTQAAAASSRGKAQTYARDWLDYARESGQSTKSAMALCVSAATDKAFCADG